jgi:hypothetical protein
MNVDKVLIVLGVLSGLCSFWIGYNIGCIREDGRWLRQAKKKQEWWDGGGIGIHPDWEEMKPMEDPKQDWWRTETE